MNLDETMRANKGVGPGFHMLRHALSWAILTQHAWYAVRGNTPPKAFSGLAIDSYTALQMSYAEIGRELFRPSFFALVGMFFALSGFLVAGSALRSLSIKTFFLNRALRILPALSVEVMLSALVLGPIVTSFPFTRYFTDNQFFRYFGNIVGHISYELPGVFLHNPWPQTVNATLWTLPAELWCYVLMLAMMITRIISKNGRLTLGVLTLTIIALALSIHAPLRYNIRDGVTHYSAWYIALIFMFGATFFVNARYVPLNRILFFSSAFMYYAIMVLDIAGPLSGIFLAYCTIYIGMMRFPLVDKLIPVDLSYGTYLYGFPITQAIIFALVPLLKPMGNFFAFAVTYPLILGLTISFSLASWKFLEEPALSLRRHFLREPPPATPTNGS